VKRLDLKLMENNITREDLDVLIDFLKGDPILTQSANVRAFEAEWSQWLGVKYSVFVNSGASANLLTMAALKHLYGGGEVIVPTLTWVSDISSVLQNGFKPVFVDIDKNHLGMDTDEVIAKMTDKTRAVFLTHVLGYNGLTDKLIDECKKRNILLIEDVCESHGATHKGQRLGSIGFASNFSFYYAHHMSTIEGGMVCTNDEKFYEAIRMLRSHGMVRESTSQAVKEHYWNTFPDLNPEFIFAYPAYNVRSTEVNAVIGRNQLKRLDANNKLRTRNLLTFLNNLDPAKYKTDYTTEGSSNYAFTLALAKPDKEFAVRLMAAMKEAGIEYRRGMSGGGNMVRQPFLREIVGADAWKQFPKVDHIHFFGFYIGNFPGLEEGRVKELAEFLNAVK
jgi:CDP-6-deoxy-D-xylo-4-hexulose-3-dehydrase